MSSSMFPGSIPLPPSSSGGAQTNANHVAQTLAATQAVAGYPTASVPGAAAFDPQTLAYYQAYYSQYGAVNPQAYQVYATQTPNLAGHQPYAHNGVITANNGYQLPQASQVPTAQASADNSETYEEDDYDDDPTIDRSHNNGKSNNVLPIWGNEKTMNLNPMLLTNIQQSPYFKVTLFAIKTFGEVLDEIWYNVKHLEPWERGSRKMGGQTGMCGSVRGVGAGGIVSTPFCILYKLFTLRLTRKQLNGLLKHKDSPFIRAIGFLYVRYTQPPEQLWNWLEKYLTDPEEFQPKSQGGPTMTIGAMCRNLLTKLDWFSTLFPRIPVPVQKDIEQRMKAFDAQTKLDNAAFFKNEKYEEHQEEPYNEAEPVEEEVVRGREKSSGRHGDRKRSRSPTSRRRSRSRSRRRSGSKSSRDRKRSRSRSRDRKRDRDRRSRSRSRDKRREDSSRSHRRSRDKRSRSRERDRRSRSYERKSNFDRDKRKYR